MDGRGWMHGCWEEDNSLNLTCKVCEIIVMSPSERKPSKGFSQVKSHRVSGFGLAELWLDGWIRNMLVIQYIIGLLRSRQEAFEDRVELVR